MWRAGRRLTTPATSSSGPRLEGPAVDSPWREWRIPPVGGREAGNRSPRPEAQLVRPPLASDEGGGPCRRKSRKRPRAGLTYPPSQRILAFVRGARRPAPLAEMTCSATRRPSSEALSSRFSPPRQSFPGGRIMTEKMKRFAPGRQGFGTLGSALFALGRVAVLCRHAVPARPRGSCVGSAGC